MAQSKTRNFRRTEDMLIDALDRKLGLPAVKGSGFKLFDIARFHETLSSAPVFTLFQNWISLCR